MSYSLQFDAASSSVSYDPCPSIKITGVQGLPNKVCLVAWECLAFRPQPSSFGPIRLADIISHHFTILDSTPKSTSECAASEIKIMYLNRDSPSTRSAPHQPPHHLTTPLLMASTAQDSALPPGVKPTKPQIPSFLLTNTLAPSMNPPTATPSSPLLNSHIDLTNRYLPPRPSQQGANPRAKYTRKSLPWSRSKLMKTGSPSDVDDHRRYLFAEQKHQQREQREREARGPRFYEQKDNAPPQKKAKKLVQPHILAYLEGMRTRQGAAYIQYRCECCNVIWTREARATALRREEGRMFEEKLMRARGGWDMDGEGGREGRGRHRAEMEDVVKERQGGYLVRWKGRRGWDVWEGWRGEVFEEGVLLEGEGERLWGEQVEEGGAEEETGSIVDGDEWFPVKMGGWVVLDDDMMSVWSLVDSVVDSDSEYGYDTGSLQQTC